ncbi:hypothetical protein QEJ31_03445 [Pigmentibacter sp. JX0631]|uniref:hypothetical protein n=1 Tax=Pigmentibacter sp. JX0631 TaxID=2976982 RepID=UPI00246903D1|nr:hypothetical protein [Pigmentibacter sp. JX0631]WGL60656.1 hypothetical protein QEJ31_03445 [Pigmentibacter sp. JX0631]
MKKKYLAIGLLVFGACGKKENTESSNKNIEGNEYFWQDPNPALSSEVNNLIQQQLNQIKGSCKTSQFDTLCQQVSVFPSKAQPKAESEGLRVLIFDDDSMRLASFTRYSKRVLLNLRENENGNFLEDTEDLKIPLAVKNILLDTLANDKYEKIPYELLNRSKSLFKNYFSNSIHGTNNLHGSLIFNYLANNSPSSQFIIAYSNKTDILRKLLTSNDSEEVKLEKISKYFNSNAESLIRNINDYNINFVSLSRGVSRDYYLGMSVSNNLKLKIEQLYYDKFLNRIANETNAVLVQSAADPEYHINKNDPFYFSDCTKNNNRIRVAFVGEYNHSFSKLGSRESKYIETNKKAEQCTDVFINIPNDE